MPAYDFQCDNKHVTERVFAVADKPFAIRCPRCRKEALQVILRAPNYHSLASFSATIDDADVQATRNPGDGSYLDPTLSYCPQTGKVVAPIVSEKQRRQLMQARGLEELPPSDKARDTARLKKTKPIHFV